MLDIKIIRENPDDVKTRLKGREVDCDVAIDRILVLDAKRRELIGKTEASKSEQNKASKEMPKLKAAGEDTAPIMARMNDLKEEIKSIDAQLKEVEDEYTELMLSLPNLPDPDLAFGGKENNKATCYSGGRSYDFELKNHVDLCTELGIIDYERGAKLAGSGYWLYRGLGARLEWALLSYFIETHTMDGYEFIMVPHMLNYECGLTAGQFPKFKNEVYWVDDDNESDQRHFMLPTAETALVSLHRDEILKESELPRKYISYSPCYRREAGSSRADERGMIRGHQFNKVEMVQFTTPENSNAAFDELMTRAETLVRDLGLKFRTVKLAAGDCSASMARTYDIEVYIPSMGGYKEVSSVSNARDYQARRGQIRFRREDGGKIEFCNTLNGSGLATSRIFPAIIEQYQQADGSVVVPTALKKYMRGREKITKEDLLPRPKIGCSC
ncbi:MAG: serine--tRNA ligase [Oscillospiraceae bacterium]